MKEAKQMNPNDPYSNDEIDLKEFLQVLWQGRKLIILITAIFAISSLAYSLLLTNYYRSESLIVARNNTQNQSSLSQYSGMASLVGIKIPSSGNNKVMEAMEIIQSRNFIKHLLTFENILPSIMASKSYDASSKELLFDKKIYDSATNTWKRKPKNGQKKPSYLEAHKVYLGNISISLDEMSGFISMSIEHISPVFAKEFLELIIREANILIRKKDLEESNQAIRYLKAELSKTSLVEIKESINALIEAQLETQMLAQINEDYILVVIDPPFIAEEKSRPKRSLICLLGTILGGILSIFIVVIQHYYFSGKKIGNHVSI